MTDAEIFQWIGYLMLDATFVVPRPGGQNPTRNVFLNAARGNKALPGWRDVLVARCNYTAAEAAAVDRTTVAFQRVVNSAPFP